MVVGAASHQHLAVEQQCRRDVGLGGVQVRDLRSRSPWPGRRSRLSPLCEVGDETTHHEHVPVGQEDGGVVVAPRDHLPGGGPGPAVRVVQLAAVGTRREQPAVAKHGRHDAIPVLDHLPGVGPRPGVRVVQLVARDHRAVAQQRGAGCASGWRPRPPWSSSRSRTRSQCPGRTTRRRMGRTRHRRHPP